MILKIVGLKEEKYIGKTIQACKNSFIYNDIDRKRHILYCTTYDGTKYELTLWETETLYQTEKNNKSIVAQFGNYAVEKVINFGVFTHVPVFNNVEIDLNKLEKAFKNNKSFDGFLFVISECISMFGGNNNYPCGGYCVCMRSFKPVK